MTPLARGRRALGLALLRHPRLLLRFLRVQWNIVAWYFWPQFIPGRVKRVVRLDMALDGILPFQPEAFPLYLSFAPLWMGSLGWMHRALGPRALPDMLAYLDGLEALFGRSRAVFGARGSTVTRPGPRLGPHSLAIHLTDRNRYCLPSLHVMIVCYNRQALARFIDRNAGLPDAHARVRAHAEEQALRIVESVILVRQHSLSDIPAALFLLTAMGSGLGRDGDLDFIDRLFRDFPEGPRLRAFLKGLYLRLDGLKGTRAPEAILVEFLDRYEAEVAVLLESITIERTETSQG